MPLFSFTEWKTAIIGPAACGKPEEMHSDSSLRLFSTAQTAAPFVPSVRRIRELRRKSRTASIRFPTAAGLPYFRISQVPLKQRSLPSNR